MRDLSRIEVRGPLAPYAGGYLAWLAGRGYSLSTKGFHLRLMAQMSGWLEAQAAPVSVLNQNTAERFLAEQHAVGCLLRARIGSVAPLLEYLRSVKAAPPVAVAVPVTPAEQLLARYSEYLCAERGLSSATVQCNIELTRPFLTGLEQAERIDFDRLTTGTVTGFILEWSRRQPKTLDRRVSALRSLLRFLHVQGLIDAYWADAVPAVHRPRLAGLPKALPSEQVAAMLASCDRDTGVGLRDLAILTVLSRLGLRAGEVSALRLGDIDWRHGQLTVCGKASRHERLPLPVDVGEAIAGYLSCGRPTVDIREVFVCARAPYRAMSRLAVTQVVARAAERAGQPPVRAHRLRHSAATAMLAGGASLTEIGQVLRHQHVLTTAIYAKVDLEALRTVARPWPASQAGR
jgi:integrase/recombinase XerD